MLRGLKIWQLCLFFTQCLPYNQYFPWGCQWAKSQLSLPTFIKMGWRVRSWVQNYWVRAYLTNKKKRFTWGWSVSCSSATFIYSNWIRKLGLSTIWLRTFTLNYYAEQLCCIVCDNPFMIMLTFRRDNSCILLDKEAILHFDFAEVLIMSSSPSGSIVYLGAVTTVWWFRKIWELILVMHI